ncbi:MAG: undecaprenyl-phosphate glucose phosphotransferase, partial [Leptospira sp.]|nr:undecaprenyl-phosphate glucose phosphotransferase [Leptospira sp.]
RIKGRNLRIGLLVGEGNLAREFAHRVKSTPWLGIELKGYVEERKIKGPKNKKNKSELQLLGDIDSMNRIIKENNIDIIYITLPIQKTHKIEDIMRKLSRFSVDIHWVPDITSFQLINHGMREIAGLPIICLSDSPFSGMNFYLKWLEDKILAIIILILISPLLLSISILIKLTSEGPVIFKQVRDGLNGEKITVWKFRTMSVHKEPEGIQAQATKNDPRVTALGAILRRTSLDEIPQFFNVIAGSMSIVGPRPHPIFLNDAFKDKIETYMLRHRIKPGITGWAQVNGWRGETDTFEKMEMRVKYDLYYINNWSLWLDLKIILMSIFKGFTGANAY